MSRNLAACIAAGVAGVSFFVLAATNGGTLTPTALDIDKLPVPDDASGALVGFNVGAHSLARGTITAQYGR